MGVPGAKVESQEQKDKSQFSSTKDFCCEATMEQTDIPNIDCRLEREYGDVPLIGSVATRQAVPMVCAPTTVRASSGGKWSFSCTVNVMEEVPGGEVSLDHGWHPNSLQGSSLPAFAHKHCSVIRTGWT